LKRISKYSPTVIKTDQSLILKIFSDKYLKSKDIKEIYSSRIKKNTIRAWKKSSNVDQNIFVISGEIKLVIIKNLEKNIFYEIELGLNNFQIVHIPKDYWYGFKCISNEDAIIINAINIPYKKSKSKTQSYKDDKFLKYDW
tara:strand:- start:145 stop:567 length:423 start_codon:yes stop_codon:yes gene_type:complete